MKVRNLCLKSVGPNGESYGGFIWPLEIGSVVEARDWSNDKECGGGLHGFLHGKGSGGLAKCLPNCKWIVFEALERLVDLNGKVKCKKAVIRFVGDRYGATQYLVSHGIFDSIIGVTLTGGDRSTLTGGDESTLTGGHGSTLTGGDVSTLTGGDRSTLTGGYRSTLTGGDRSTLTGGDWSILTGGDGSTLTSGNWSTLTGGDRSTLTGGYGSTLTGGDESTLTGRYGSTLTGGYGSTLLFKEGPLMIIIDNITFFANKTYHVLNGKIVEREDK